MEQVELKNVSVEFKTYNGYFKALDNINFCVKKGENVSLIGESGSGKSTIAKLLIGLIKPSRGSVLYDKNDISIFSFNEMRRYRRNIQSVFQDASGTLNPAISTLRNLKEGLIK